MLNGRLASNSCRLVHNANLFVTNLYSVPFICGAFMLIRAGHFLDCLPLSMYLTCRHNSLFRVWIGPKLYIFLKNSSEVEQVFINNPDTFAKSHDYDFLNSLAGEGIFCQQEEQVWHRNRKIVNKLFHYSVLKHYVQTFHDESHVLVKKLEDIIVNNPSDIGIHSMLATLTLNTIARNTIGIHIDQELSSRMLKAVEKFFCVSRQNCFPI